jgi:GT2 family glycosyltransferase
MNHEISIIIVSKLLRVSPVVVYFEDADICFRMKKAGFKIYFIPGAQIIHVGGIK